MKKKRGLCMAAGGLIEDKEAAWARRKAEIYASTGLSSKRREPEPEVAPAPPPAPAPAPQRRGGLMGAFDALTNRKRQIEEAAGYAQGGIVRGPGGPEDDEVPMQIAGKDVRLSNTEAVLPARTVQALGGPKAVERLIEVTNGKPPVKGGLRAGGRYYLGGILRGAKAAWKMGKSAVDDAAQAAASGADDAARAAARPANQGTMYQGRTRLDGSDVPPPGGPAMSKYEGSGVGQMVDAAKNIGGKVLKGGLALGGIGAAAESGFEAGNDINKVLANEKLGTLDKIGGVAEAAGNAMLSIPTLGLIDKPATKLGELVKIQD